MPPLLADPATPVQSEHLPADVEDGGVRAERQLLDRGRFHQAPPSKRIGVTSVEATCGRPILPSHDDHPLGEVSRSETMLRLLSRSLGVSARLGVHYTGAISRLTIHACLPTCRPRVNP